MPWLKNHFNIRECVVLVVRAGPGSAFHIIDPSAPRGALKLSYCYCRPCIVCCKSVRSIAAMHSDVSSGSVFGNSEACAVAASIGNATAARQRRTGVSGSAVEATCSHFGSAGLVMAAEEQLTESASGYRGSTIPMLPLSWVTDGEDLSTAPGDRLSAAAGMASGAVTSMTNAVKPSERQVMRGDDGGNTAFSGPTQVISRSSHSTNMLEVPSSIVPHDSGIRDRNLGRSSEDRYPPGIPADAVDVPTHRVYSSGSSCCGVPAHV